MVAYEFTGYALVWRNQFCREIRERRMRHAYTWADLKRELRSFFVLALYARDLYNRLQHMYQGSKSIEDYHKDMELALTRANMLESSEATMTRFIHGLSKDIYHYASLDDLVHQAIKVEAQWPQQLDGVRIRKRRGQEKTKFLRREVPYPKAERRRGHYLVLFLHPKAARSNASSAWARGQLCLIIIDSGSIVNVASSRLVEKLKLPTLAHSKPHRLQWLNSQGELTVTKQVSMTFTLGNYEDKVLCDAVHIELTHILIGRPWQCDLKVTHDNLTNRFTFVTLKPLSPKGVTEDQLKMKLREKEKKDKINEGEKRKKDITSKDGQCLKDFECPKKKMMKKKIEKAKEVLVMITHRANPEESKEIQEQVRKLKEKGWVKESKRPCVVLVILVLKKDKSWTMYMDYHPINAITIRYRHSILCLDDHLDELHECDEWKIAFKSKFGLYELLVMPFGLTNVLSMFMKLKNHVKRSLIGRCVTVYFDDILVYSACLDNHDESLYVNLEKCTFYTKEVVFLGFFVGSKGVQVDQEKVKAIQNIQY
ncbi:Retrovirus-related Pol polyprotein from transposon 17.6, partial [Mucuna pruriens]